MRGDSVYANALGRALYAPMFDSREQPPNAARFTFLDPAAQQFFTDWEKNAKDLVAALRSEAGRNPYDRALSDLIGELSTRSEPFRKWWAAHNVRYHNTGRKRLHHPTVGDLELDYEVMQLSADSGLLPGRLQRRTRQPLSRSSRPAGELDRHAPTRPRLRATHCGKSVRDETLAGPQRAPRASLASLAQ